MVGHGGCAGDSVEAGFRTIRFQDVFEVRAKLIILIHAQFMCIRVRCYALELLVRCEDGGASSMRSSCIFGRSGQRSREVVSALEYRKKLMGVYGDTLQTTTFLEHCSLVRSRH